MDTRRLFFAATGSLLAFSVCLSAALAQGKLAVGARVEDGSRTDGHSKGTVKEVGSGAHEGCYLIVFDGDPSDPKKEGYWVCDHGIQGRLFALDGGGRRDINDPNFKPAAPAAAAPAVVAAPVVPAAPLGAPTHVAPAAQHAGGGQIHVGDRVEVLSGGRWYPGTVTRGLEHNAYAVAMDKDANKGLQDYQATPGMIRAGGGAAPAQKEFPKSRPPVKCNGPHKGARGQAPSAALVHELFQCAFEDTKGGALINADISGLQIGAPRPWTFSDFGDGTPNQTRVYPVHFHVVKKTFGDTMVHIAEEDVTAKVYVDNFGNWVAGIETERLSRPLESIYKKLYDRRTTAPTTRTGIRAVSAYAGSADLR